MLLLPIPLARHVLPPTWSSLSVPVPPIPRCNDGDASLACGHASLLHMRSAPWPTPPPTSPPHPLLLLLLLFLFLLLLQQLAATTSVDVFAITTRPLTPPECIRGPVHGSGVRLDVAAWVSKRGILENEAREDFGLARASRSGRRRRRRTLLKHSRRCHHINGRRKQSKAAVAERLQTLRTLIPPKPDVVKEAAASDRLFKETADYILLLQTQVEVLKRLVDIYSPSTE
ncbi:hypothetical protein B296_00038609 [Ensete ventricosum]|uniref:BHLH domain-containing protein n=1 Tax=Ensete ventricosum TaxID=4639 RepID=A0A426YTZ6_ENSVE|nr:hypothetical protein B296_00038609 [Ensete ventricosum]